MIDEVDQAMERWLRAALALPPGRAEISFDQPVRDWDARRAVPLLNLFLYSIAPSRSRAVTGGDLLRRTAEGQLVRERRMPVMTAKYLVSVWGGSAGVEHELLGRLANLLAAHPVLPREHLGGSIAAAAVELSLWPSDGVDVTGVWSALDVPSRPGLQLRVRTPMGLSELVPTAQPPQRVRLSTSSQVRSSAAWSVRRRSFVRRPDVDPQDRTGGRWVEDSARPTDGSPAMIELDPDGRPGSPDG